MPKEIICGIECSYPDAPLNLEVGANYFVKTEIPSFFNSVDRDLEGSPIWNEQQIEFIDQEIERCTEGMYIINKNIPTYLPPSYYYYLNYYTLEDGISPEYREASRIRFLFAECVYKMPKVLGHIVLKARRAGVTSETCAFLLQKTTFNENYNGGILSFNDALAEIAFQTMVRYAFFKLPEWLRPRVDRSSTSKKELHFINTPTRGKNNQTEVEGLNSIFNFQPLTSNPYDSTRLSGLLFDETGKVERFDVNKLWNVVKECIKKGGRKVGHAFLPTTVGEPQKGGQRFKEMWDKSNQYLGTNETETGIVQFFMPSYLGLEGFIDQYGHSVVDTPDEDTLKYLIDKQLALPEMKRIPEDYLVMGAKKYLEYELDRLKSDTDKSDFKRKYPIIAEDSFDFGNSFSPFNLDKIKQRRDFLVKNPIPIRRGDLEFIKTRELKISGDYETEVKIEFKDNDKGCWQFYGFPEKPNSFYIDEDRKMVMPTNTTEYGGGADTFRSDKTQSLGSMGTIVIGSKFDETRHDGGGIIYAIYVGRPKLAEFFWEEIMKACLYFGCIISVENDATGEYRVYFANRMKNLMDMNCLSLLGRKPNAAIDPNRANAAKNITVINSSDPFIFAKQIELAQIYFEKYCDRVHLIDILEKAIIFNPDNRTVADLMIGFMMYLLNISGQSKAKSIDYKNEIMIPTYKIQGASYS